MAKRKSMLEISMKGEGLGLLEVFGKLKNFKPVFQKFVTDRLNHSTSYTRPDRFLGLAARSGEPVKSWAPGYFGTMKHRVRNTQIQTESTRPFAPIITDKVEAELAQATLEYVMGKDGSEEGPK